MVLALVKLFFCGLTTLSNFISLVAFKGGAYVIVLILQILWIPGAAVNFFLSQFKEAIMKLFGLLFASVGEGLKSAAGEGSVFVETISEASSNLTTVAINLGKEWLAEEFANFAKEIMKEAWEMVKNIGSGSWVNLKDGAEYIFKHIFENPHVFFNFF